MHAVVNVSLDVADSELLVLLGPSGSGKTTILRLIAGLTTPDAGDIAFDGKSILDVRPEDRRAVMVFQNHELFPFRTVGENVGYGLKLRRVPKAERSALVAEALASVRLAGFEDRWPDELSGGQAQRVALARALVVKPRILLLDEPLTSLDQELRGDLRDTICNLQRSAGITTVMVTHDQEEARVMGDRLAIMIDGRIRQVGPPDEVRGHPADGDVAQFLGCS